MTPPIGVWLFPDASVGELVDAVVRADDAGLDEIWIADEGVMRDPTVVFAAAARHTTRIRMGIGITSPALRHPGAIASTVATIDELSGGRMMLGFGVGGGLSLEPFGLVVDRPVALVRDALRTARAVLRRESGAGYDVADHAAPARSVPLYVASRGEQINRLASREADGVFLSGFAPERLATIIACARSERDVAVALYQSVHYGRPHPDDPTSVHGDPAAVAEMLHGLHRLHQPTSLGIALVDGDPLPEMMTLAIATFEEFRRSG